MLFLCTVRFSGLSQARPNGRRVTCVFQVLKIIFLDLASTAEYRQVLESTVDSQTCWCWLTNILFHSVHHIISNKTYDPLLSSLSFLMPRKIVFITNADKNFQKRVKTLYKFQSFLVANRGPRLSSENAKENQA